MIDLRPYQKEAATHLAGVLGSHPAALDASDTGTGKTFTALGVARELGLTPLVVCPLSVQSSWKDAADALGVEILDALNIEKLKTGKTGHLHVSTTEKRVKGKLKKVKSFTWNLPRGSLIIWDEAHQCSGMKSQNSNILAMTKAYGYKVLMLSATAAESPLKLKAIGYLLGLHRFSDHWDWCLKNGCVRGLFGGLDFLKGPLREKHLGELHSQVFPVKGTRVRIADIPDFPETLIMAESYDMGAKSTKDINKIYDDLEEELEDPETEVNPLVALLRARQATELYKIPLMVEMTNDMLDEGMSVVIFVSFKETLNRLTEHFSQYSVIQGGQSQEERDTNIKMFQSDANRVCLTMIQAGGVGVSLHDTHGNHPRAALLTPTFNAIELKQALGRIHRNGGKSKSIQKILFAGGTVEEQACKAVKRKLENIAMLNDADLSCGFDIGG